MRTSKYSGFTRLDKKFKYNSADEEISLSNSGEDSDDDDQIGKVVPCMYGAKCWRKNPDHLSMRRLD